MTNASNRQAGALSYRQAFMLTLKRDLIIAFRHKDEMINPLLFFIIVITLFPLGIGPQPNTLAKIAPGIIWVSALLATLLSLDRLFKADHSDGSLEQMLISPQPLFIFTLAKICAHWLLTGLPLILIAPLLAVLLHLPEQSYSALMLTLLLGTPVLSFIGAIGAALTVGIKKGGVLLSLIVLPLYIPVLIFATSAIDTASLSLPYNGQLAIIAALFFGSLTLAPFAVGAALKVSTN
ncbi:heme exporter protein CcmB [Thalassotalea euphylliae]|uniref:Heme exporter protein B n=1 Tax=Thalassotalea euphylliae TaxID=1655234 RepID=A0A3E0U4Q9_9GAMM|nr:heme exporter protein CcmB [Thalassotalea euphylliae]REL31779.1 heme exporter protein CcmB [Thalassotalea euphylliae]REL36722.1 heme exporter protein CcmB [Thalassotalea euphylliae]